MQFLWLHALLQTHESRDCRKFQKGSLQRRCCLDLSGDDSVVPGSWLDRFLQADLLGIIVLVCGKLNWVVTGTLTIIPLSVLTFGESNAAQSRLFRRSIVLYASV